MKKIVAISWLFIFYAVGSLAQNLMVADIFSDNMVLQQASDVPVWGTAKAGTTVTITPSWNKKMVSAVTGKDGKWKIILQTPVAGGPYSVAIKGETKIELKNVYLGEVWLASGQSNMSMPLKGYYCQPVMNSNQAILASGGKNFHFINIPSRAAHKPQEHFKAQWIVATPETVGECSAVAWFFADLIHRQLTVPVGIINASFGGSNVEAWMTPEACKKDTDIKIPPLSDEISEYTNNVPTTMYNAMIYPVAGYGIRGMIWYQGESNVFSVSKYASHFTWMVDSWRKIWNQGNFPLYYAQIAPYEYKEWNFFTPEYPEISAYIREAQLDCSNSIPNCGMAVLLDVGEQYLIHPPKKQEVGERLALLALSKTYGQKGFEAESPQYDSLHIEGDKAYIYFKDQFNGITCYGKDLTEFEIAGDNRVFQKADAYIDWDKGYVVVSSHLVSKPVAVRYAFKNFVQAELFGTGGLPVSSFRTDRW